MATTRKSSNRSTTGRATSARRSASQSAAQRTGGNKRGGNRGGGSDNDTPERDSNGRFKADHHVRNAAVGGAVVVGAVAAGVAAAFKFGLLDRLLPAGEGHDAEDLLLDADDQRGTGNGRRAGAAFRPDVDAPMTKAEREALRPAKGQRAADLAGADNGAVEEV